MALKRTTLLIVGLCLLAPLAQAQTEDIGFAAWRDRFMQEARAQGISLRTLQNSLPYIAFDESVIELDRKQPEHKITFAQYLDNVLPDLRIKKGQRLYAEHAEGLRELEQETGVPASVIVALWGMESSFGENMGDNYVLTSLATLAYEGRRADFFQNELLQALAIIQEEGRRADTLRGSWAGAMGQCQFMPSTYRRYAVDYNQDGVKDIWDDDDDAMASIANYLRAEGWKPHMIWGTHVKLARPVAPHLIDAKIQKTQAQWAALGVSLSEAQTHRLPAAGLSLVQPDGASGPSYLVTENFQALMRWNRSTYFATAVGLFADRLKQR